MVSQLEPVPGPFVRGRQAAFTTEQLFSLAEIIVARMKVRKAAVAARQFTTGDMLGDTLCRWRGVCRLERKLEREKESRCTR